MIKLADRLQFGVGRGIHEIDRVRHVVFDRELDRIDVITQRSAQRPHVLDYARLQFRRQIIRVVDVLFAGQVRLARIVRHDHHFFLPDAVAANELIKVNELLQSHAQRAGLIVLGDQLFQRVDARNVLPAATVKRFHDRRQPDVVNDRLPIEGEFEIAQTLADDSFDVVLLRQQHRPGDGDAEFPRQREIEKLVVCRPPEGIVDDDCALQRQTLQGGAIKRHLVRDAIDYQVVRRRRVVTNASQRDEVSRDCSLATLVNVSDQGCGKSVFPPN